MGQVRPKGMVERLLTRCGRQAGLFLARKAPFDPLKRQCGLDWPPSAHTMIGLRRLDNLQKCLEDVITTGFQATSWRQGSGEEEPQYSCGLFSRPTTLRIRSVWAADSFEGLPKPDPEAYPEDTGDTHHAYRGTARYAR